MCYASAQSRPTVCDPVDCNPPGSSVHGIFQARILEWVASSSSRGSSQPRDQTNPHHPASPASQADSLPSEPFLSLLKEEQGGRQKGMFREVEGEPWKSRWRSGKAGYVGCCTEAVIQSQA